MKLSNMLENESGVARGFGIAAPEADIITYVKARAVVRFLDLTRVEVTPAIIYPRKDPQIVLSVQPMVVKQSDYNNDVSVKVIVTTDYDRLESSQTQYETLTLIGGNTVATRL